MDKRNKQPNKLTDKAFSRLWLTSVIGILLCLACLCSTTFAWFSDSAPSAKNEIKTAEACFIRVTVKDGTDATLLDLSQSGTETLSLDSGEYGVSLSLPQGSASGYCVLTADEKEYYSPFIARNDDADGEEAFTLVVAEAKTVAFTLRWGIYSGECSVVDGVLEV